MKTDGVTTCNGCNYGKGTPTYGFADYDVVFVKPGDANSLPVGGYSPTTVASGTSNWSQETVAFTAPPGVTQVQIRGILYGRGTVWFDDVSLTS